MALRKVKGNIERMFDKNLTDLVRGIRNNKNDESKYIGQCIEEIKEELRQENINVKCNAVAKLTYIQMLGYDISWAGFNIIEVMSSPKFTCKRIGYLAASQCFHPEIELIMLTTNMVRKDLNSQNQFDAGVALSGLSCFISSDLARDLANDIMTLMSSTKPYLRMKAVLMMYKVFLRYPEALRPAFPRLKEKLEDPDPGVQSAAVNVICELARKNPKNYLSLAPIFFKLMTTSTNNWMLIKIIKLFGSMTMIEPELGKKMAKPLIEIISREMVPHISLVIVDGTEIPKKPSTVQFLAKFRKFGALTPLEPRLGKKLIEPLTNLIHSTSAMSLLYECINTVIAVLISISSGMPNHSASIQLCVQKLRILIEDSDQNLKYLGLLAMSKILKTHPKSVQSHKDLILACLDDKDESIRLRALDLLYGMVSKKNLMEIVRRLLGHMERAEGSAYRDELLFKVIEICSQGSYQYVTNFEWYLTVLVELIQLETGSKHGNVIATQLLDVSIRVQAVRSFAVSEMTSLLEIFPASSQNGTMHEVLYAAAYIVGEFGNDLNQPEKTLNILLKPRTLPGHIQGVYVQNIIKLFSRIVNNYLEINNVSGIIQLCDLILQKFPSFISSGHIEVQERASAAFVLIEMLRAEFKTEEEQSNDILTDLPTMETSVEITNMSIKIIKEINLLFCGDLNPVAPKAQRKVPVPDGLNLDEWINTPPSDSSSSSEDEKTDLFISHGDEYNARGTERIKRREILEPTPEELKKSKDARKLEQSNNPNYLKGDSSSKKTSNGGGGSRDDDYEDIPIAELALEVPLHIHSMKRSDKYLPENKTTNKKSKKTKKSKKSKNKINYTSSDSEEEEASKPIHLVNTMVEVPEGATLSDNDDKDLNIDANDPHRALDIDLEFPERMEEVNSSRTQKPQNKLKTSTENVPEKIKKSKQKTNENEEIKVKTKSHKEKKDKKDKTKKKEEDVDLLGTPVKEKHRKKEKKIKNDSKMGYEEAIGISTPSKEMVQI